MGNGNSYHQMSAWLSPEEIIDLTARKRWSAQSKALADLGVPFMLNAVGRPLVERAAVLRCGEKPTRAPSEPNWAAMEALALSRNSPRKR